MKGMDKAYFVNLCVQLQTDLDQAITAWELERNHYKSENAELRSIMSKLGIAVPTASVDDVEPTLEDIDASVPFVPPRVSGRKPRTQ